MLTADVESTMIEKFRSQIYTVNDFVGWHDRGELVLSPNFQRRRVWTLRAKSYLIDTIVRGMPIPQVFIRQIVHPSARRTVREVVDGQQRLSTIIDFIDGKFTILPVHNLDMARKTYDNLPEVIQRGILEYPLTVNVLNGNNDAEVLEIFSRINAYSITLNRQENLNAEFSGAFKQSVHMLARRHLAYWRNHRILTPMQITRMGDVDLTADLVATMMTTLHDGSSHIREYFKTYDDEFQMEEIISVQFDYILSLIEKLLGVPIEETEFRRTPLFYPLFTATYATTFGFGSQDACPANILIEDGVVAINVALQGLSDAVKDRDLDGDAGEFIRATQRGTNSLASRNTRHEFLRKIIQPFFVARRS